MADEQPRDWRWPWGHEGRRKGDAAMARAVWIGLVVQSILFVLNLVACGIFLDATTKAHAANAAMMRAAAELEAAAAGARLTSDAHRALVEQIRRRLQDAEERESKLFRGGKF